MTMIGLKSKSDEVYIVFIDTEEQKSTEIKLKDFQALWRALIADREIAITGKELSDELDKINKPTKLRVITEKN